MKKSACTNRVLAFVLSTAMVLSLTGCSVNDLTSRLGFGNAETQSEEAISEVEEIALPEKIFKQIKTEDTIELGTNYSFSVNDFFESENIDSAEIIVNSSRADLSKVGDSNYIITCDEQSYSVTIHVVDTVAPELTVETNPIVTNTLDTEELLELCGISATDLDEVSLSIEELTFYSDFSLLAEKSEEEEEVVTEGEEVATEGDNAETQEETSEIDYSWLLDRVNSPLTTEETENSEAEEADAENADQAEDVQEAENADQVGETDEAEEEIIPDGIYVGKAIAVDASGNTAEEQIVVLYDATAPVIDGLKDKTVYQNDVTAEPSYSLDDVTVIDNLDGEISIEECTVIFELEDETAHKYVLRITAADKLGNESTEECFITVRKREVQTPAPTPSQTPAPEATPAPAPEQTPAPDNAGGVPESNDNGSGAGNADAGYTPAPAVPSTDTSGYAQQVLDLVNAERAAAGLSALTMNYDVLGRANTRAVEIDTLFSHTRPDGTSCFTALDGISYMAAGENIAAGQRSPSEVVTGWMNSEGHRANILSTNYTQIGIGVYYNPNSVYGYYWVQLFIG